MELLEIFQSPWAMRALIASSMVGIMCGALGAFVVLRNMSLIGDALAHAILPGIVVAFIFFGHHSFGFFVGAVIAGLLTAFMITWIQKKVRTKNDAAIGIVFTTMFAIGVIGISRLSQNEGVHLDLKDFLFGSVLGVSDADLQLTGIISLTVLAAIAIFFRYLFITTFQPVVAAVMGIRVNTIHYLLMLLLSFAVVASLRTVGVILVVAMLITPAATALLLSSRLRVVVVLSAVIGLLASVLGLAFSILLEITPGPAMAVTVSFFYVLAMLFSPSRGLIFNYHRKRSHQRRINTEDLIKELFHLESRKAATAENLVRKLGWSLQKVQQYGRLISKHGLARMSNGLPVLTEAGVAQANKLIRAHRLWESYLVSDLGLTEEQIHDDAERYEHLLTEDIINEVDAHLGYPVTDPHGAPIPESEQRIAERLSSLPEDSSTCISPRQLNTDVINQLWQLGLTPGEKIRVVRKSKDELALLSEEGQHFSLTMDLANQIYIHNELEETDTQ